MNEKSPEKPSKTMYIIVICLILVFFICGICTVVSITCSKLTGRQVHTTVNKLNITLAKVTIDEAKTIINDIANKETSLTSQQIADKAIKELNMKSTNNYFSNQPEPSKTTIVPIDNNSISITYYDKYTKPVLKEKIQLPSKK